MAKTSSDKIRGRFQQSINSLGGFEKLGTFTTPAGRPGITRCTLKDGYGRTFLVELSITEQLNFLPAAGRDKMNRE